MMLRLAPVSLSPNPNKVVIIPPSWTRIPTFAAPRHQLVTRKTPNSISLCCSNVDAKNSILAKPLKSETNSSPTPPKRPDDFPFLCVKGNEMIREFNREKIHVSIFMPKIIKEDTSESEFCLPETMNIDVKVSKGNGTSVTFWVEMCPHVMKVHFVVVKSLGMRELRIKMEEEEIGKLESAIQEYLEVRGIKPCYAEYFYRYMVYRHMEQKSDCGCSDD